MRVEIKRAARDDIPAIVALHSTLEPDEAPIDLVHAEHIFERMQQYPNYHIYVAVAEGAIIATFALLIMDNLAHQGTPSGIVEDVVVHPSWQGKGIGKQVMHFAIAQCEEAGCYKLMLSSNSKRQGAHRFYETLGFEKHGYSFLILLQAGSSCDYPPG